MTGRNVFENNTNKIADEDVEALGDGPHIPLPELKEGYEYAITDLPSGRKAVIVEKAPVHPTECDQVHEKYKSCPNCSRYYDRQKSYEGAEDLNSPESRTLRHRD